MFYFTKGSCRRGTDTLAGAVAAFQFRKPGFNRIIALAQRVIISIRNQRRIILIIGGIMFFYFSRQTGKLLRRFGSR